MKNEFQNEIDRVHKLCDEISGVTTTNYSALLTDDFMKANTKYASFQDMINDAVQHRTTETLHQRLVDRRG